MVLTAAIILCAVVLTGCPQPGPAIPTIVVHDVEGIEPATWTIITGDTVHIRHIPDRPGSYFGSTEQVLSTWADGILVFREGKLQWVDLNIETGAFEPVPNFEMSGWNDAFGVDPFDRAIYAFGHSVPPSRNIMIQYLDMEEPMYGPQLVADEVEKLYPLTSTGWFAFYVDRPGQANAITIDNSPTRKMRIYHGRVLGAEFPDVLSLFFLEENVVVNREDHGWMLFDSVGALITQRTMSLDQIPGDLRPLSRFDDMIYVATDEVDEEGNIISSVLWSYGAYSRDVAEVWNPVDTGQSGKIMAMASMGGDEFYIVLGVLPDLKHVSLNRYSAGEVTEVAYASFNDPVTYTQPYFLQTAEEPEALEVSTVEPEIT